MADAAASQAHDATAGFHDIKPLPEFSPFPLDSVLTALGLLAAVLLSWILFRRRSRRQALQPQTPPLSPLEAALAELRELELLRKDRKISLRDFSSRSSLALRLYLERTFQFPAAEQTGAEVTAAVPGSLRRALPLLPHERIADYTATIKSLLRFFEVAAFAGNSTEKYQLDGEEIQSSRGRIEALLREIETHRKREEERTRSVVDSGGSG